MKSPASKPLNEWTASEIVAAIGAGRTTCEAVMRACLDRIAAREAEVAAWTNLDPARALAAARAFDRNPARGPLAGVPFGLKDIIDTQDYPTEWGTPIHRGRRPNRDAACVALTRRAGGVLLGKTVTTEFANLHPGPTRNPHDLARTPGGSSSGSAAAVADHMVPIALGTQTTGSTIRPASFCGVFGYRPTHGEHRLHGVMEASGSLDTLGILARSLDDIALYRDVLLGISPQQIADVAKAPRIGLYRPQIWDQVEPTTRRLVEDAARSLAKAGADIHDVKLPEVFAGLNEAHRWRLRALHRHAEAGGSLPATIRRALAGLRHHAHRIGLRRGAGRLEHLRGRAPLHDVDRAARAVGLAAGAHGAEQHADRSANSCPPP